MKLTNEQKTRLLAEVVMGWKFAKGDKNHLDAWKTASGYIRTDVWKPLTNESHAAEVREAMRAKGWNISQSYHPCGLNTTGIFMMPDGPLYHANKGSASETICHAALLALGLAGEEEL